MICAASRDRPGPSSAASISATSPSSSSRRTREAIRASSTGRGRVTPTIRVGRRVSPLQSRPPGPAPPDSATSSARGDAPRVARVDAVGRGRVAGPERLQRGGRVVCGQPLGPRSQRRRPAGREPDLGHRRAHVEPGAPGDDGHARPAQDAVDGVVRLARVGAGGRGLARLQVAHQVVGHLGEGRRRAECRRRSRARGSAGRGRRPRSRRPGRARPRGPGRSCPPPWARTAPGPQAGTGHLHLAAAERGRGRGLDAHRRQGPRSGVAGEVDRDVLAQPSAQPGGVGARRPLDQHLALAAHEPGRARGRRAPGPRPPAAHPLAFDVGGDVVGQAAPRPRCPAAGSRGRCRPRRSRRPGPARSSRRSRRRSRRGSRR